MIEQPLVRCTPESQGISSMDILAFIESVEKNIHDMHSFMLMRHGAVVAEGWWSPYGPKRPHMMYSLSKSFTSSAIGLAISEGLLSLDDPLLKFFEAEAPARVSKNLAAMRVRHLLSMSTGHAKDTTRYLFGRENESWAKLFLALPVKYEPGSYFLYNTGATYMLSAILQKLTGMTLLDYLKPRLFNPLGIENPTWESDPQGINLGGTGLNIRTEDIARFGQMLLQKGRWHNQQVLPSAWIEAATSKQIENGSDPNSDWTQGYGYQFWRCKNGGYRGDGAFGQYCVVLPEQDAVLAITSGVTEMQGTLDLVWNILLPSMQATPREENPQAQAELTSKLSTLALLPPAGKAKGPAQQRVDGKVFQLKSNRLGLERITFEFPKDDVVIISAHGTHGEERVVCGKGVWVEGATRLFFQNIQAITNEQVVAASATWTTANTLMVTQRFIETPYVNTFYCHFTGDQVHIRGAMNVSFGPRGLPRLVGSWEN